MSSESGEPTGGWSFTGYDDALVLCVSALVIKVVLVTLLTVRTRMMSGFMRKTPEETENSEDSGKAVVFIIFYIFKPLLLAGMPGKPAEPDGESEEETAAAVRSPPRPARALSLSMSAPRLNRRSSYC